MNIEEFLSQVDIVDVVSYYIPDLKPVGRNYSALCPFHIEDTPSFFVSPDKQIFKCFGCGVGGNAITFVQKIENISFWEAVKRICEICSLPYPEEIEFKKEEDLPYEKILNYFKNALYKNKEVLNYLKERKIDSSTIEKFFLGYAPKNYKNELIQLGINKDTLIKLGLLNEREQEFFKNRLIIPIFNESGKLVGFGARSLDNSSPKYINTKENEFFKKRKLLYGLYQAKENLKFLKDEGILFVEGYFDVISCHRIGLKNAVAPMGTSLTREQIDKALIFSKKINLGFDGDFAGIKASFRAISLLIEKLITKIYVLDLPFEEDPDSLIRKNEKEFLNIYKNKLSFEEYIVKKLLQFQKDEDKFFELLDILGEILGKLKAFFFYRYINLKSVICEKLKIPEVLLEKYEKTFKVNVKKENNFELPIPSVEKLFIKTILERYLEEGYDTEFLKSVNSNLFLSLEIQKLFNEIVYGNAKNYKDLSLKFKEDEKINNLIADIATLDFKEDYEKDEEEIKHLWDHIYFVSYKEILKRNLNYLYRNFILKKQKEKINKVKNLKEFLEDSHDFKDLVNITKKLKEVVELGY